jgi:protein TonB
MRSSYLLALVSFAAFTLAFPAGYAGETFKIGTNTSSRYEDAQALEAPRPEIPSELAADCFKSCCVARFKIKNDGKYSVMLVSTSGSEEVDEVALSTLRRWRFKPAMLDGKPVESTRKIRVEFEVN